MRRAFQQWVKDNEALAWAGLALSTASFFASPAIGLTSVAGGIMLVLGGAVAGVLGTLLFSLPSKHPLVCLHSDQTFTLRGERGAATEYNELLRLRANKDAHFFALATRRAEGKTNANYFYRNLGPNGKPGADEPWFRLNNQSVVHVPHQDGTIGVNIEPPAPIRRGDHIEIRTEIQAQNSFPSDEEWVAKSPLYPTKDTHFNLRFCGCPATDFVGLVMKGHNRESAQALTPTADGGTLVLRWSSGATGPGDSSRVQWRWM